MSLSPRRPQRRTRLGSYYVPDGLSEEQYQRIQEDEQARWEGMEFERLGPRFAEADGDPDGNWFSMPALWTGEFDAGVKDLLSKKGAWEEWRGDRKGCLRTGAPNGRTPVALRPGLYSMLLVPSNGPRRQG